MGNYENEMMAEQSKYGNALAAGIRNREIVPSLKAQRDELTKRIEKIDTLLGVLEKNPDFAKMFDLACELV